MPVFIPWDFYLTWCPESTFISSRCLDHAFSSQAAGEGSKDEPTVNQL